MGPHEGFWSRKEMVLLRGCLSRDFISASPCTKQQLLLAHKKANLFIRNECLLNINLLIRMCTECESFGKLFLRHFDTEDMDKVSVKSLKIRDFEKIFGRSL